MRNRIFCFSSHFFQFSRFGFRYLGSPLAKPSRACAFSSHREKVADTGNIGTFSLRCTSRESPRALRVAHLAQTEDAMPVPNYRIRGRPESGNATFQPNPRAPGQTRRAPRHSPTGFDGRPAAGAYKSDATSSSWQLSSSVILTSNTCTYHPVLSALFLHKHRSSCSVFLLLSRESQEHGR